MPVIVTKKGQQIIVDQAEYEIAKQFKWVISKTGKNKSTPVTFVDGHYKTFSRVVFGIEQGQSIAHKNGNKLDFTRDNILICKDKSEFWHVVSSNRKGKSSQYHGVCYNNALEKWVVQVRKNGKVITGGRYNQEDEAGIVADYLMLFHYGDIAARNFPELNMEQFEKRYNEINEKYGSGRIEKISRAGQGRSNAKYRNKTSKYVGVSWSKKRNLWTAQISHTRKVNVLGRFLNEIDAARAYDKKAKELYGEHAKLNLPEL
ncbi:AP2 domain-containing protein [Desulforamulus putei DSM 12395]|uniref:AP2 domain-containing protein n=1 Tax=Desulforamulus putei DSM 12395 TaxID=1121429 RepID=A0A1M5D0P2_9FIRM|nr:AP2 domain-containing protein [Desulforamulus putei]SHF60569.1 AP2 domain-containing protein [Desulforamulus putei DSM 12395]